MKKMIERVGRIIAVRLVAVITIAAVLLLAGGIAMKTDVATAMIVVGSVLLIDIVIEDWRRGSEGSP